MRCFVCLSGAVHILLYNFPLDIFEREPRTKNHVVNVFLCTIAARAACVSTWLGEAREHTIFSTKVDREASNICKFLFHNNCMYIKSNKRLKYQTSPR